MFVFGVEVRLAVFCLKQHFETDRDRFKTSNLFFQNSNVRRIIGLRVSQHIGAFVFTVFFYSKSKYTEQQSVCTRLKAEAGTPWISTLHHLTCLLEQVQFFSAFTWRGGGNHSQLAIPFNGGLGRVVGHGGRERGATFFQFFWSPLPLVSFSPSLKLTN